MGVVDCQMLCDQEDILLFPLTTYHYQKIQSPVFSNRFKEGQGPFSRKFKFEMCKNEIVSVSEHSHD